ncbi:MAG: response regulator [Gemmatimonadota bacterium]
MAGERILIVEDEAIVAKDVEQSLKRLGYQVTGIARYGTEAVGQVARTQPDLVLMDIRLQGDKDGIKTAEVIGARFGTPVVFVTAHSDKDTVERARHAKPAGFLTKPLNYDRLQETVERALAKGRGAGPGGPAAERRATILLVDDAAARQAAIIKALGKQYRVKVAPSFSQATRMLKDSPVDLVVVNLDLRDALRGEAIRQLRRTHHVTTPMIVMGQKVGQDEMQLLKDEGVVSYLALEEGLEERLRVELDRALGTGPGG